MFFGHFAMACGAKRLAPRASLATSFGAAQLLALAAWIGRHLEPRLERGGAARRT